MATSTYYNRIVIVGLFKTNETTSHASARNLTKLLDQYDLRMKIIAYVKNESANLNTMMTTLKYVMNCEVLDME